MMTLKEYLKSKPKLTQVKFAAEIGVTQGFLSDIASGKKKPGFETITAIDVATKGKVPPSAWFPPSVAKKGRK